MALVILLFASIAFSQEDFLLKVMSDHWKQDSWVAPPPPNPTVYEYDDSDAEAEAYSWDLGTPDNVPELIIIYEDGCE